MVRVKHTTIYGTDFDTLGILKVANTLGTLVRVNHVDCFPFSNCLVLALRFTCATADTFIISTSLLTRVIYSSSPEISLSSIIFLH